MDIRKAAQAVIDRWDSTHWCWSQQGPTADLMNNLRAALAEHDRPPVTSGYFKVVDGPREPTLEWDGPAEQAQDLIPPEDLLVCGQMGAHVTRVRAEQSDPRQCTCHPDDNPPHPCPRQYALDECRRAAEQAQPVAFLWQHDETGRTTFTSVEDPHPGKRWHKVPLYAHPPAKPARLADDEIDRLLDRERMRWSARTGPPTYEFALAFGRAVESAVLKRMGVSDE